MADGGIVVSGGVTGHGTLLACNLLYSPLMLDANRKPTTRPSYTLGGTAGVAGFEAAFAADKDIATLFKTAASDDDQAFTMIHGATPPTVYGVVVLGHNITSTNVSLAKFEGGNDTNYNTVSEDLTLNAATLSPAYHLLASPQAYDHWRIRVNFTSSLALEMGEVFLIGAAPLAFTDNYNKHFIKDLEIGKVESSGIGGVMRVYSRWERVRLDMVFDMIPTAQLSAMQIAARNGHVIFSPEGVNSFAYFGALELEQPKHLGNGLWNVTAHFTESAN